MTQVFDFHLHPGYDFHNNDTDYDSFVAQLKKEGVTGCAGCFINAAVNGRDLSEYEALVPSLNEKTWQFHKQFPDFFVPGIHIHPEFLDMSQKELIKHKDRGGVLVGELVYYMMGWRFDHKNICEMMAMVRDLDMVVSVHLPKDVSLLENIMKNVKDLKMCVAHLGGYGLFDDVIALMQKYPAVTADLSAYGAEQKGMLAKAVKRVGSERILYGTDYPGSKPCGMSTHYINYVLSENITDSDKENILYKNAKRILNL